MPATISQFDRLFDSLPRYYPPRIRPKTMGKSLFPMMQWPLNRFYLGFTPQERRREHQMQVWLQRAGMIPRPGPCSVCGITRNTSLHAENYYDLWSLCSICQPCHKKLHMRHRNSFAWAQHVEEYSVTGNEWFRLTPLDSDADFAGYLRYRFGPEYTLHARSLGVLPQWVIEQFPEGDLMPFDFRPGDPVQPVAKPAEPVVNQRLRPISSSVYPGPIKPMAYR